MSSATRLVYWRARRDELKAQLRAMPDGPSAKARRRHRDVQAALELVLRAIERLGAA